MTLNVSYTIICLPFNLDLFLNEADLNESFFECQGKKCEQYATFMQIYLAIKLSIVT